MKKIGVSILFLLVILSFSAYAEVFSIVPSTECIPQRTLFKISNSAGTSTNAHAEVFNGQGNYPNAVCYMPENFPQSDTIHTCYSNDAIPVLKLSAETNAHAETGTLNSYTTKVCYRNMQCTSVNGNCNTATNGECVVRLSSETNAHLSSCSDTNYPVSICCKSSVITPTETTCDANDDCQEGYGCSQGKCKRTCNRLQDCGPLGQYLCRSGFCDSVRAGDLNNACVADSQCQDWQRCSSGNCAPKTCDSDEQCNSGQCNQETHECKTKDSEPPVDDGDSSDGVGRSCILQEDCDNGNICSPETGKCERTECSEDSECTTTGETCAKYGNEQGLCLDCSKDSDGDKVNDCNDFCPRVRGNTRSECESNIPSCESLGGVDCTGGTCLSDEYTTTRSITCCKPNANNPTEAVCNPGGQYVSALGTVVSFQKSPCIDEDGDGLGTVTVTPMKQVSGGGTVKLDDNDAITLGVGLQSDGTYVEECTTLPRDYNGPETPFYTYISIFLTLVILGMFYMSRLNRKL
ncbi:MAG: hypothetical protein AABW52_02160 [Nanoarchaeota archaeon]